MASQEHPQLNLEQTYLMKYHFVFVLFILFSATVTAQRANDLKQSIITQAHFSDEGALTISWHAKDGSDGYRIKYRSNLDANWDQAEANVKDTFYTFAETFSAPIEVFVETIGGDYATGYILAGNEYFAPDQEERMLILVTHGIYEALADLIERYRMVLLREMIRTDLVIVDAGMTIPEVKDRLVQAYESSPLAFLLILGHVPVPYAGNYAVDGHDNHKGAWVADAYYGDIDGNWTDVTMDNTDASRDANQNVPGDGKFDQTSIPSNIEVAVGRVDFSDLPKLSQSEVELTRRYIQRNMDYRMGKIKVVNRAIIDNNFNHAEGFAQGAIKSFHTFLEPDSINYGDFAQCTSKDYLFTFGAGSGSYQSAGGIITTNKLVTDSIQSIFTTIFGSYFGDWDNTNNLLRVSLARGSSLINAWSGRPIWYFHHMAMGKPVGQVLLNTINNNGNYYSRFGKLLSSISLLGDPSLKMYYHAPVVDLQVNGSELSWSSGEDPDIDAYTLYTRYGDSSWTIVAGGPIYQTNFDVSELVHRDAHEFMVRPVTLIPSRSGSYYNEGIGTQIDVITTGTDEYLSEHLIYPNPAGDYIRIKGEQLVVPVSIFDMYGRMILKTSGDRDINVSNLVPGTYVLMQNNEAFTFIKK